MIDGAGSLQILRRIFLPAVVPAIITVVLFAFIMSWNEFLGALVMMTDGSKFTLPLILANSRTATCSVAPTGRCCKPGSRSRSSRASSSTCCSSATSSPAC